LDLDKNPKKGTMTGKPLTPGQLMLQWIQNFRNASPQTKFFIFNWVVYGFMIVATMIYCYARLDYVRSYKMTKSESSSSNKT